MTRSFEHEATRRSELVARDGHRYIVIGETMVHHTDLTDEHQAALNNPRPAGAVE